EPVKSLDFIVFGSAGARLVVDVKGRRFPGGPPKKPRRVWECWVDREDVAALHLWAHITGPGYEGAFVFAYCLGPGVEMDGRTRDLFFFRGRRYLFRAVKVVDYSEQMRQRSPRWDTVDLPQTVFRSLVRPVSDFTGARIPQEVPF